jgi:hypothetical protein
MVEKVSKKEKYLIGARTFAGKKRTSAEKEKLSKGFRKLLWLPIFNE